MTEGSGRPAHLIHRDEVPSWLADSVVKQVTYHNTTPAAAAEVRRRGVRIGASRIGSFGQGFYSSSVPEPFHGPAQLEVAIRLRSPLVLHLDDAEAVMDRLTVRLSPLTPRLTPTLARRIRRELLAAGYDGLVIYDAGGDGVDYVVAFVDEAVRIVVDD